MPHFRSGYAKVAKNLSATHPKIRMMHMRALKRLRKTQSQPPKLFRRHNHLQSSREDITHPSSLRLLALLTFDEVARCGASRLPMADKFERETWRWCLVK